MNQPVSQCPRSNRARRMAADGYWQLVAAGEPFRLLFPLGALAGICGALLWPLHVWGVTPVYPGPVHSRVMIEGFLALFVAGFLGTALPRLLDVPRVTIWESLAVGGVLILVAGQVAPSLVGSPMLSFGRLLLNQGFLLLPVMGIGAFLLPRFFGLPNRQSFNTSLSLPPGWLGRAGFAMGCGLAVLAGFALEAAGFPDWGCGVRALAVLVYFLREAPWHRAGFSGGALALALRIALAAIPTGYLLIAIWPERMFSFLHVVFISGFSLITFAVATRVVLGHSGQAAWFGEWLRPVLALIALFLLAMLTRVTADWMPAIRLSHYAYAALAWAAGVLVRACTIMPSVTRADAD